MRPALLTFCAYLPLLLLRDYYMAIELQCHNLPRLPLLLPRFFLLMVKLMLMLAISRRQCHFCENDANCRRFERHFYDAIEPAASFYFYITLASTLRFRHAAPRCAAYAAAAHAASPPPATCVIRR